MTVLIGYVPTPVGDAALAAGLAEAAIRHTDVVILNSPRRGATVDPDLLGDEAEAKLLASASKQGVRARVDHAAHGSDIVATFESLVESTGADLVVLGLRHRSPVGKLVMGSDAQRLLLELAVPILAVKPAPR
jgi:nucleotide-binding universal stress UspA family protein